MVDVKAIGPMQASGDARRREGSTTPEGHGAQVNNTVSVCTGQRRRVKVDLRDRQHFETILSRAISARPRFGSAIAPQRPFRLRLCQRKATPWRSTATSDQQRVAHHGVFAAEEQSRKISSDDQVKRAEEQTIDGIRHFTARTSQRDRRRREVLLLSHSDEKQIVGIGKVIQCLPDSDRGNWATLVAVTTGAVEALRNQVALHSDQGGTRFKEMPLVGAGRLSVQTVTDARWKAVRRMSRAKAWFADTTVPRSSLHTGTPFPRSAGASGLDEMPWHRGWTMLPS